jgi:glycosyltransferase involved in cell wall biosynthesis
MTLTDELPLVTVVIETVTARFDLHGGDIVDNLAGALSGIERQSYPQDRIETVVVVDPYVAVTATQKLRSRFPFVKLTASAASSYCAGKNAGIDAATGSVVAMLDGDCAPHDDWLERLVARMDRGVAGVAGRTRYVADSLQSRTLSIPGFGYVVATEDGTASGMNLNNVAIRTDVLREHPLDERIRRNGGCVVLFRQLRAAGEQIVYEPDAVVAHANDDIRGSAFVRKHFGRGFDAVAVYGLDSEELLRGTRFVQRYGAPALVTISLWRVFHDWSHMWRYRRQIGIRWPALPYFAGVSAAVRSIELVGMLAAVLNPDRYAAGPGP